jgi:hypothetical protein
MVCHCSDCQVLSGAPYRAVVAAPVDTLSVTGTTKSYVKVAQSGNRRAQVFCPECGTPPVGHRAGERHLGDHPPRLRAATCQLSAGRADLAALGPAVGG